MDGLPKPVHVLRFAKETRSRPRLPYMMEKTREQLETELNEVRAERNKYHALLTDYRLSALEKQTEDHERRLRPLEDGQVKANTIYALFAGNSLLSIIALVKIFAG